LQGKWSFVFFGYTFCPDVCPTTLAAFRDVHARLADTPALFSNVQFVLVSVDPERDTPARLREYVTYFGEDFLGVTGTNDQLDQITRAVGAVYAKVDDGASGNYLVDHTASVFLVDPEGRLHAVFSAPLEPAQVVSALAKIRERRG
jgi:protein SCO1/2